MSDSENSPASRLSRDTTPTWEMELLISGVTVFALLQLPGAMDHAYLGLLPKLDQDWDTLCRLLFTYSKMGVLILSAAFVLHLTLRAYWIALVGMNSIYPDGVNWDRLKVGLIQRRLIEDHGISMLDRIETADNRASIVFALGITMTLVMVGLVLVVSVGFVVSALLAWLLGWKWLFPDGGVLLLGIVAMPYAIAYFVDRGIGKRLSNEGGTARALRVVFRASARIGLGGDSNPTIKLLQSHVGERKVSAATFVAILVVASFVTGQLLLQQNNIAFGAYADWPDAEPGAPNSVSDQHYRDQASPTNALLPTIESMFPGSDFLSLIVPFNPKRHPALLAEACPAVWHAEASPEQRVALLDCMGQLQELKVDGQAMPTLPLNFYADPRTGQNGVLIVIPIGHLGSGQHSLSLKRALDTHRDHPDKEPNYRIAFWK